MKNEMAGFTTNGGDTPVLQSVHAVGQLDGLVLSMTLRQVFRNATRKNMEVVYAFPLSWGAVLLGLEVALGGQRLSGQVRARQEATAQYEQAVAQGDAPVMVQQLQNGMFSASLGSLRPGEVAEIEISYAQLLGFEQDRLRLVLPTTLAPRYGSPTAQAGLTSDQVPTTNLLANYNFTLQLDVRGTAARASISSPSHQITQQASADSVRVDLRRNAWLDRDFILVLEGLQGQSFAVSGPDTAAGQGHMVTLTSFCPQLPPGLPAPLRLKVLVDCSGSMAGDSIGQARLALAGLAEWLGSQDQFTYSRFGSQTQRVLGATAATGSGLDGLKRAIRGTEADLGGTEMHCALRDTFGISFDTDAFAKEGQNFDVLLITDGEVWDAQKMVDEARRSGHRIYALGVGTAPAESLLQEMAVATGGACLMVHPHEDMREGMKRLLERMRCATAVNASLEGATEFSWISDLPRRLASGETVHVFSRSNAALESAPTLRVGDLTLTPSILQTTTNDLIARLAAAQEVAQTADAARATAIAERYQLVTCYTSFLLVFERQTEEKTDGMPALHQVAHMLPAGWGGSGSVQKSARVMYSITAAPLDLSPSVWRANRTQAAAKIDALACADLDGFEVPAFLRKQSDVVAAKVRLTSRPKKAAPMSSGVSSVQVLAAFNAAVRHGQVFRHTLRVVTSLSLGTETSMLVIKASALVKGPVNAWACYLLWLHEAALDHEALSAAALDLLHDHLQTVTAEARAQAYVVFAAGA